MKELFTLFEKSYPLTFFESQEIRTNSKLLCKNIIVQSYFKKITTPLQYYQAQMILEALKNKEAIQNEFELFRNANQDLWQHINYSERNLLFKPQAEIIKKELKHFVIEDRKRIFVPIFSSQLNYYYDVETAVFDLKQYYNLYFDFKKELVALDIYKGAYYKPGQSFAQCFLLNEKGNSYILVDPFGKCLTFVKNKEVHFLDISSLKQELYTSGFDEIVYPFINDDNSLFFINLNKLFPLKKRFQKKFDRIISRSKQCN